MEWHVGGGADQIPSPTCHRTAMNWGIPCRKL